MQRFTRTSLIGSIFLVTLFVWILIPSDRTPADNFRNEQRIEVSALPQVEDVAPARRVESTVQEAQHSGPISSEIVGGLVRTLSSHPKAAAWMVHEDLLRRFVTSVESIAEGYCPRDEIDFLRPIQPFVVQRRDEDLVISESSFQRYDLAIDVFCSMDASSALDVYEQLKPEISSLHKEIAWVHPDFDERLVQAIDHLLEVPVPYDGIEVERGTLTFMFADSELERLTDAQRQLLRTGPRNIERIQSKLREFRTGLTGIRHPPAIPAVATPVPAPISAPIALDSIAVPELELGSTVEKPQT